MDVASLQAGGDSDIKTAKGLIITLLKLQQNNFSLLLTLSWAVRSTIFIYLFIFFKLVMFWSVKYAAQIGKSKLIILTNIVIAILSTIW